jgi:hypothetical protein
MITYFRVMDQIDTERATVLTRDTYYQVIHDLWRALPPPVSDHSETRIRRDNAAMAVVASLLPADPEQAELACKFVAACAHAKDCLRLVNEHAADLPVATKCRAQALSMMRQACAVRSLLLRIQQDRRKNAALGDTSSNEPAWSDHGIVDRMTEALRQAPAPAPKTGPEEAIIPETIEAAVSTRDAPPAAASAPTEAPAKDVPVAQAVSVYKTGSGNRGVETITRFLSPAFPIGGTPGPHAALRPPSRPNERLEAIIERVVASVSPAKQPLSAFGPFTGGMNRTQHSAGTMPRVSAA